MSTILSATSDIAAAATQNHDNAAASPLVEFYFDVSCPWCWMTSRWASEVAAVRGFTIKWLPISLQIINENNPPGPHTQVHTAGHRVQRVIAKASQTLSSAQIGALYTALGERVHPGERRDFPAIIAESLSAAALDADLAASADDAALDEVLRANTAHALEIAGPDVGVPIIAINGVAFFGPVVTPAPTGEQAVQLWDGIYAAASVPGFYELKRGRSAGPQF